MFSLQQLFTTMIWNPSDYSPISGQTLFFMDMEKNDWQPLTPKFRWFNYTGCNQISGSFKNPFCTQTSQYSKTIDK